MRLVAHTLHAYMGQSGECYPSRQRAAASVPCDVRTYARAITRLEAAGLIERGELHRGREGWATRTYRAVIPAALTRGTSTPGLAETRGVDAPTSAEQTRGTSPPRGGHTSPQLGAHQSPTRGTSTPLTIVNHKENQTATATRASVAVARRPEPRRVGPAADRIAAEFLDELAERRGRTNGRPPNKQPTEAVSISEATPPTETEETSCVP